MRGIVTLGLILLSAASPAERYAVVLNEPPLAEFSASHKNTSVADIENQQKKIKTAQASLRHELKHRGFAVTGAVENVLNAIFVLAPPDRVAELRALPGVKSVVKMHNKRPFVRAATKQ